MSDKSEAEAFYAGTWIGGFIVAIFFGVILTVVQFGTQSEWRKECIERGIAEYDSVSGEWQWKESK